MALVLSRCDVGLVSHENLCSHSHAITAFPLTGSNSRLKIIVTEINWQDIFIVEVLQNLKYKCLVESEQISV